MAELLFKWGWRWHQISVCIWRCKRLGVRPLDFIPSFTLPFLDSSLSGWAGSLCEPLCRAYIVPTVREVTDSTANSGIIAPAADLLAEIHGSASYRSRASARTRHPTGNASAPPCTAYTTDQLAKFRDQLISEYSAFTRSFSKVGFEHVLLSDGDLVFLGSARHPARVEVALASMGYAIRVALSPSTLLPEVVRSFKDLPRDREAFVADSESALAQFLSARRRWLSPCRIRQRSTLRLGSPKRFRCSRVRISRVRKSSVWSAKGWGRIGIGRPSWPTGEAPVQ